MNLVIDWGNSTLKVGWFDGATLISTHRYASPDALLTDTANRFTAAYPGADLAPERVIVSSTSRPASDIRARLSELGHMFWVLDAQTPVPLRKAYDTPHTLGADRVAAAVGALSLFPGRDCVVLDLGTCLTADLVDHEAVFQGGLISPGLQMRLRAMHEQTARLPLVSMPDGWPGLDTPGTPVPGVSKPGATDDSLDWPSLTAKNTQQAMQSGVANGLAFELNGIINAYRRERPDVVVLLCGGDAPAFESRLKPPIFAVPDLVLIGLNRILRYNVENLQADTPDVNA